ncbi:MAG: 1-aminocyclopropane-1-carboxylate deaminase [Calditrichaeota bacterium]|nr:MAG: 1-aminocyclopropane-1-carboxylate deaminase [Calditrichota bacterium]
MNLLNFIPQVQTVSFRGRKIHVVRDDLSDKFISGNKFRKLYFLLKKDFLPLKIITSGGIQSNFLLAISRFCFLKKIELVYVVRQIPKFLKENPIGNYKFAKEFGTKFYELETQIFRNSELRDKLIKEKFSGEKALFIEFGGAENKTLEGMQNLVKSVNFVKNLKVILPSGTGSSSYFLQKALLEIGKENEVHTVSCVGNSDYLKKQFSHYKGLVPLKFPVIIENDLKRPFGKVPKEIGDFYFEFLEETGIELDLLYGSYTLFHVLKNTDFNDFCYIHTGGIIGNESLKISGKKISEI